MSDSHQARVLSPGPVGHLLEDSVSKTRFWWILLITGAAWIIVSILNLRFDYTTAAAVAALSACSVWQRR